MKRNLRWEKHGDVYVARDEHGCVRYFIWLEKSGLCGLGPIGATLIEEFHNASKIRLMAEIAKDWRSR